MSRLLLARHGVTDFNNAKKFAGCIDVELSEDGLKQAERLRDRLSGEKIDAIYSSDLKRAMATTEVISSAHNTDIVACPELREMNYGYAEGLTYQEIKNSYPEIAGLIADYSLELDFPGGESFRELIERTCRFVDRLDKYASSETVLIVSHNGPLRVLVCHLLDISQSDWRQIGCDNASLSILEIHQRGTIITLLNDTSHLRGVEWLYSSLLRGERGVVRLCRRGLYTEGCRKWLSRQY